MDKLNNDKKFLSEADDGAEFEIPDTPLLGEFTEDGEGKAAAEEDAADGNIADNDADTAVAASESDENAIADEAATEEVEAASDAECKDEAEAAADTVDEGVAVAATDAEDKSEDEAAPAETADADASGEAEADIDDNADTAEPTGADADNEADAAEPMATDTEAAADTANDDVDFPADIQVDDTAPTLGEFGSNANIAPASEEFETDAEGRRIVPEGYIPDNALYVPAAEPAESGAFIDLLGDPMEDTPIECPTEDSAVDTDIVPMSAEVEEKLPTEEKYDPEKPRRIDTIFDFIELLIFTLVAVLFVTSFFFKHAVVDGPSMLGTLEHGDVLIISDLFYEPRPGDIVVFEDYSLRKENYRKPIVKRVIAVEGQRVVVKRDGIYVSYSDDPGEPLYEPYVYTSDEDYKYDVRNVCNELAALESFGRNSDGYWFIVPEGEVFVLGDHRDDSTDSRTLGTIRVDAVLGRVLFRVYPFDKLGRVDASFDYEEK